MQRQTVPPAFLLAMCFIFNCASAQTPATQPTPPPLDTTTPMAFMISYDRLAGEDPPAYLAMYDLDEQDDIQRLAKVQAKFDAQVGMLQKIIQEKWGDDAVDQMLHALGLKSLRDIQTATVKEIGDRATVVFSDGTPGPELIKTKAGWRLDLPAFCSSLGMPVDDYLKQIHQLSNILPDVADGVVDQKLKDPSSVVSDIVKRISKNDER
jgi:hypothetical protein